MKEQQGKLEKAIEHVMGAVESAESKYMFFKGLLLGILLGIAGNVLVTHYSDVFRGLIYSQFDTLFWVSLVGFTIGTALVFLVSFSYFRTMQKIKKIRELSISALEDLRGAAKLCREITEEESERTE